MPSRTKRPLLLPATTTMPLLSVVLAFVILIILVAPLLSSCLLFTTTAAGIDPTATAFGHHHHHHPARDGRGRGSCRSGVPRELEPTRPFPPVHVSLLVSSHAAGASRTAPPLGRLLSPGTMTALSSSSSSSSSSIISEGDDDYSSTATVATRRKTQERPRSGLENEPTYHKSSRHPSKPAQSLLQNYDDMVRSAHVRHILLETKEMADLALKRLFGDDCEGDDPFGDLARSVSACTVSRMDGGRIGWVDNPNYHHHRNNDNDDGGGNQYLLPEDVVRRLFGLRPRGGDVHVIESDSGPVHIIRVDDLQVDYIRDGGDDGEKGGGGDGDGDASFGGGRNRVIRNRRKLPGVGIRPNAPAFDLPLVASPGSRRVVDGNDGDSADTTSDRYHRSPSTNNAAPMVTPIGNQQQPRAKTYHISTVGCQMNVADSERMAGVLNSSLDLTSTQTSKDADVVILNTCSIRDHAEQKLYDQLGPHAARKRRGEHVAIVVSGCVAQQEGEDLLRRVPEIDAVVGPQYAARLGDVLMDVSRGHQVVATDPTLLTEDMSRPVRGSTVRAWVSVIHGCNEHCTYCVVPHVRGVEQSRSMESILDEVRDLGRRGYREVTLLGQNIDAYGRDMTPRRTFADLLRYLNDNVGDGVSDSGIRRIRYVTSHPRYFSDRVIDAVAELDMVCECFHMPFQSGDDDVLRRMRRGYTHDSYMKIIDKIKKRAPNASICGDVIVGFPGESDVAFQRTLDLMKEVKFDNLNTFAYSPRPNTEASRWTNQIPDDVKSERLLIVQKLATEHAHERSERYLGAEVEVLVEERNMKNPRQVMGRTRQGRPVFFDGDIDELCGSLERVKITEARPWSLTGYLL